jgi:hypothetical protein
VEVAVHDQRRVDGHAGLIGRRAVAVDARRLAAFGAPRRRER